MNLHPGALTNLAPGQVILDKYRILRKLGNGAMGDVWLVEHTEFEIERALKVILQRISASADMRKRFRREAKIMARLEHPHAVRVYDFRLAADFAYIEMEYVEGRDIQHWITPGKPMPLPWIGRILGQLCSILELAHEQGVVHRDLKPSNMMILSNSPPGHEHLKVLDFGIARIIDSDESMGTGNLLGTIGYASPEQLHCDGDDGDGESTRHAIDSRSDIYSIGVMLYEFLTGHRPFEGGRMAVLLATAKSPPPPMAKRNPQAKVDPELERLVMRCLAKSPANRPKSVRELADEFFRICPQLERPSTATFVAAPSGSSHHRVEEPKTETKTGSTWDDDGTDEDIELAISQTSFSAAPLSDGTSEAIAAVLRSGPKTAIQDAETAERQASQRRRSRKRLLAATAVFAIAVFAVGIAIAVRGTLPGGGNSGSDPQPLPDGFTTVNGSPFFQGDWPDAIKRRSDDWKFIKAAPSVYLPEGYKPNPALGTVNPNPYPSAWPAEIVRESDGVAFRLIAGGTFQMGRFPGFQPDGESSARDLPAHPVRLDGYYLQVNEVTNGEIEAFLKSRGNPSEAPAWRGMYEQMKKDSGPKDAAQATAAGLSRQLAEDFALNRGGRLPTEAQWEFAARSRDQRKHPYVWEGDLKPNRDIANVDNPNGRAYVSSRFSQDQTDQGIFAMMGNVREWCRDNWRSYAQSSQPRLDPFPEDNAPRFSSDSRHAVRGASHQTFAPDAYVTRRDVEQNANAEFDDIGFRIVIECPYLGLPETPSADPKKEGQP